MTRSSPAEHTVSVVIPTRDRPELLRRAIRSVFAQTYEGDIEVLVVFDQEEPSVPGIAPAEGRSIRLLSNGRRPGLAGTRNSGILSASGSFVAFCDDDDTWHPDKIRRQLEAFATDAAAEVTVTGTVVVYGSQEIVRIPPADRITFEELLPSRMQSIHPSSILVRRAGLLEGIGLVDEEIPGSYGEDYDWLLRAARRHPILVVRAPLTFAYWHQSSFFADRWATIIEAIHYFLAKYPEIRQQPRALARRYGRLAFAHAALGEAALARSWAWRTLRVDPRERRAYLALVVSTGLVSADTFIRLAHRRGRGI